MTEMGQSEKSRRRDGTAGLRSEEHTSELQSQSNIVCRLLLEKKKTHKEKRCFLAVSHMKYSHAAILTTAFLSQRQSNARAEHCSIVRRTYGQKALTANVSSF